MNLFIFLILVLFINISRKRSLILIDCLVKGFLEVLEVVILYPKTTLRPLLPLALVAIMLGNIVNVWIISVLSLNLGTFFYFHIVKFNIDVIISQNSIAMSEPLFELTIEDTVALTFICLENFPTSPVRFIFFEFALVRLFTFLFSPNVVSDFSKTMFHIMKIVPAVICTIDKTLFAEPML